MRILVTILLLVLGITPFSWVEATPCHGQVETGKRAPVFSLARVDGKVFDLSDLAKEPLVILYFFDATSPITQHGLSALDELLKKHKDSPFTVWSITSSSKKNAFDYSALHKPNIPVLVDDADICKKYGAHVILPTACILGPDLKVLDYVHGGGKSSEILMTRLAERELQRNHIVLAKKISHEIVSQNPANKEAQALLGYAMLKEGRVGEAEMAFQQLSEGEGASEVFGKEGLAAVYLKRGQEEKAMQLAQDIEEKAPKRGNVNVIKGKILISKNQLEAAQAEFQKAGEKEGTDSTNRSVAYNSLGQIQASKGNYETSIDLYDKAVEIDPYLIEAASNKGISYEREDRWDMALSSYRQALSIDSGDGMAAVLSENARKRLALQKDMAKKDRIDHLVKELSKRFKDTAKNSHAESDTWTTRPMILTFIDVSEKGGLPERGGMPTVLISHLGELLSSSGRVQVVERVVIEALLSELNLGSSDLANQNTALKLGRVLSAKLIATGTLYHSLTGTLLSLRLIDTETSEIMKVVTKQLQSLDSFVNEINTLNRVILKDIIETYPLQGYVVKRSDKRLMINVGSDHGVVLGTAFEVLKEQEPIEYKGKKLAADPTSIAQIEVVEVQKSLCYAKIVTQEQTPQEDDLVREVIVSSN